MSQKSLGIFERDLRRVWIAEAVDLYDRVASYGLFPGNRVYVVEAIPRE